MLKPYVSQHIFVCSCLYSIHVTSIILISLSKIISWSWHHPVLHFPTCFLSMGKLSWLGINFQFLCLANDLSCFANLRPMRLVVLSLFRYLLCHFFLFVLLEVLILPSSVFINLHLFYSYRILSCNSKCHETQNVAQTVLERTAIFHPYSFEC